VDWQVDFHPAFAAEYASLPVVVQDELAAMVALLGRFGPEVRRPRSDKLHGSKHTNMKELRFDAADGVWRVAYAFDPDRKAILLVAGDKSGVSQTKFYKALIRRADRRFDQHLVELRKRRGK
jgi:hypothetical protein